MADELDLYEDIFLPVDLDQKQNYDLDKEADRETDTPSSAELEQLREISDKLSSQNLALKKNISCLFKTAQQELQRKESMIDRLMKRIKRLETNAKATQPDQPSKSIPCGNLGLSQPPDILREQEATSLKTAPPHIQVNRGEESLYREDKESQNMPVEDLQRESFKKDPSEKNKQNILQRKRTPPRRTSRQSSENHSASVTRHTSLSRTDRKRTDRHTARKQRLEPEQKFSHSRGRNPSNRKVIDPPLRTHNKKARSPPTQDIDRRRLRNRLSLSSRNKENRKHETRPYHRGLDRKRKRSPSPTLSRNQRVRVERIKRPRRDASYSARERTETESVSPNNKQIYDSTSCPLTPTHGDLTDEDFCELDFDEPVWSGGSEVLSCPPTPTGCESISEDESKVFPKTDEMVRVEAVSEIGSDEDWLSEVSDSSEEIDDKQEEGEIRSGDESDSVDSVREHDNKEHGTRVGEQSDDTSLKSPASVSPLDLDSQDVTSTQHHEMLSLDQASNSKNTQDKKLNLEKLPVDTDLKTTQENIVSQPIVHCVTDDRIISASRPAIVDSEPFDYADSQIKEEKSVDQRTDSEDVIVKDSDTSAHSGEPLLQSEDDEMEEGEISDSDSESLKNDTISVFDNCSEAENIKHSNLRSSGTTIHRGPLGSSRSRDSTLCPLEHSHRLNRDHPSNKHNHRTNEHSRRCSRKSNIELRERESCRQPSRVCDKDSLTHRRQSDSRRLERGTTRHRGREYERENRRHLSTSHYRRSHSRL